MTYYKALSRNKREILNITWAGLIVNSLLALFKFLAGFFGNSQSVIADAIHSLSDTVTDFAVIIGVKYWSPPADKKHPYGHKRIETLTTLIIGLVLGFAGFGGLSRSEEHTSELQSHCYISYAVFCVKKKKKI